MRLALLCFVIFVTACGQTKAVTGNGDLASGGDSDGGGDGDADGGDDVVSYALTFTLESDESIAGEPIGYTVTFAGDDGSSSDSSSNELTSDLETDLSTADDSLTATVAGTHTLTVNAIDPEGEAVQATATLNVGAAEISTLLLTLSESEVVAGDSVTASMSGQDEYGNEITADEATLEASDGVTIDGENLTATTAGEHTATATMGDLSTESTWTVTAGAVATVDLVLEDTDLEQGDDTEYSIVLTDEYGNETSGDVVISADEGVEVNEDEATFTFNEEGVFNCHAMIDGTELGDTETITIDSGGPDLTIFTPERADWGTDTSVNLTGTATDSVSAVSSVTLNGAELSVSEDGSFESELDLSFGINTFETIAADSDFDDEGEANESKDVRSVLQANEFQDPSSSIEEGLVVRMWEGEGGLGQLESMADGLMDSVPLDSLVEGTLFTDEGCFTILFWPVCWDVSVVGESISYGDVSMNIDATDAGTLDARVTISDLEMLFQIVGDTPLSLGDLPADGSVTIDAVHVDISLTPAIEDGALVFTDITYTVPDPEGITVTLDSSVSGLVDVVDLDMEAIIAEEIVAGITGAMDGVTDGLFDDVLGSLDIAQAFDVSGMSYTLYASAHDVSVDDGGMTLSMQTQVTPEEVLSAGAVDGVDGIPYYGFAAPSYDGGGAGTQMGLSTDVLNQMMFAFWQGGMLDQTLTEDDLGLDPAIIGLLLPGVTAMNIITTPLLPPVIVPTADADSEHQFELKIGSLLTSIYDEEITDETLTMELYVAATVPLSLSLDEDGAIAMTLEEADVLVDLTYMRPDLTISEAGIEDLLGGILADYLPELTGDLGSIPMPELDGFAIEITSTEMGGSGEPAGYWVLSGSLE